MGYKEWAASQRQKARERQERLQSQQEAHRFDGRFGRFAISGDQLLTGPLSPATPVAQCHAEVVLGGKRQRMTVTRVGAGALLFGPVGALVGGMAKKDLTKNWLIVATPGGVEQVEVAARDVGAASEFAMKLEQAAAHFESR